MTPVRLPASRIEVVVCTRDRLSMLRPTVEVLRRIVGGHPAARLVLVDNASADGTAEYIAGLAAQDPRVVALSVPQPGLYHARAAAIAQFSGDILVFVDDDVVPAGDLLERLDEAFADPTVGVVGAAIGGHYEAPLPAWFLPRFLKDVPVLPVHGAVEDCHYPSHPPGVCLALRAAPCLRYYLAPQRRVVELGWGGGALSGEVMLGGDDTDLCELYARGGYRVVRDARVRVDHRVIPAKLTPAWVIDKARRDGHLRVRLARLRGKSGVCGETARMLAALPAVAVWRLVWGWGRTSQTPRGGAILARAYYAKSLGAWRELLRGRRDRRLPYPPDPLPVGVGVGEGDAARNRPRTEGRSP